MTMNFVTPWSLHYISLPMMLLTGLIVVYLLHLGNVKSNPLYQYPLLKLSAGPCLLQIV